MMGDEARERRHREQISWVQWRLFFYLSRVLPPPPPPIVFSFDLGPAFSSVCCIPAKAKAHGRTFSRRIEHVGFSKLTQANLTEAEVERFMSLSAQL